MRIPSHLLLLPLLLVPATINAQDLQLKVNVKSELPELQQAVADHNMTMSIKGARLRIDQVHPTGGELTMIYDSIAGKTWVLLHAGKIYMESDQPPFSDEKENADSAALAAASLVPVLRSTGERQMIAGHEAERHISVVKIPKAEDMDGEVTVVFEHWLATDARLNAAYYAHADRMKLIAGPNGAPMSTWEKALKKRIPLRTTMLMLPADRYPNPDANTLLRDPQPAGLKARVVFELEQIRTSSLPDSLFKVPEGYTQAAVR